MSLVFHNPDSAKIIKDAKHAIKQLVDPSKAGLRQSMADITAYIEVITHRLKYNLEMRDMLIAEYTALQRRVGSRSS